MFLKFFNGIEIIGFSKGELSLESLFDFSFQTDHEDILGRNAILSGSKHKYE
jgi:hypothetical protein